MIDDPVGKAKSVVLTDEGLAESERLFRKLFERSPRRDGAAIRRLLPVMAWKFQGSSSSRRLLG